MKTKEDKKREINREGEESPKPKWFQKVAMNALHASSIFQTIFFKSIVFVVPLTEL